MADRVMSETGIYAAPQVSPANPAEARNEMRSPAVAAPVSMKPRLRPWFGSWRCEGRGRRGWAFAIRETPKSAYLLWLCGTH
jgi:hypothetical protein